MLCHNDCNIDSLVGPIVSQRWGAEDKRAAKRSGVPMAIRLHIYSHARPRSTSATESAQNGHLTPPKHFHGHKSIWVLSTVFIYDIFLSILNFNKLMNDKISLSRSNWRWSGLFDVIKANVYTYSFRITYIVFSCSFYRHQDCLNPPRLALDGYSEGGFSSRDPSPWTITIENPQIWAPMALYGWIKPIRSWIRVILTFWVHFTEIPKLVC